MKTMAADKIRELKDRQGAALAKPTRTQATEVDDRRVERARVDRRHAAEEHINRATFIPRGALARDCTGVQ
jgi:hypothetical protein